MKKRKGPWQKLAWLMRKIHLKLPVKAQANHRKITITKIKMNACPVAFSIRAELLKQLISMKLTI